MNLIKILMFIFGVIILIIFPYAYNEYQGNKFFYILFTCTSSFALFYNFRKESIFFETFLSLLLWLGFWFKFSVQVAFLNSMFPEGFGHFSHKPEAYDEVILVSQVAILALIFASYIREKFFFSYVKLELKKKEPKNIIKFYLKFKNKIIYFIFSFLMMFFFINLNFSFFQKGTVPDFILPFGLNNIFKWMLMFGFSSFFSVIIYLEFLIKKKNSNNILKFGFLENFFSSISSISRAMIFNSTAIFYGYYRLIELNNFKINKKKFIKYFSFVCILFLISLLIVSKIRQTNNFPIGHQVHEYLPTIKNMQKDTIFEPILEPALRPVNDFILEMNQILFLIAGRWVGVDSLMAVQSINNKGLHLIYESLNEKFDYSNSFYENKIKRSYHTYKRDPKVYTIYVPGIVGYLYYSNSLIFVFIFLVLLSFFCSFIELISYKISESNIIFASLIGNVLAYRLAHFGYMPLNSYKILLAILMNLLIIYLIFRVINYIYKK
jgi:hypothetical protein